MSTLSRKALTLAFVVGAALLPQTGLGRSGTPDSAFGFLRADAACPQTAYSLIACPCDPPQILYYVYSTKVDLSQFANNFVSLRGTIQAGNCQANLFQVKKATLVPPISCPCPASSVLPAMPPASGATAMSAATSEHRGCPATGTVTHRR